MRRYLKEIHTDDKILPRGYLKISQVYIGGVTVPSGLTMSQSKVHFTGCMQDIWVSQVCIFSYCLKTISNLIKIQLISCQTSER